MLELQSLSKNYGKKAVVDQVSFSAKEGQTVVLLGTSGSGKTTTLKMINRLIEPTSGKIMLNGQDVLLEEAHLLRRKMGFVIQNVGLFPHFSIAENIATIPKLLGWDNQKIETRCRYLLELVGLEAFTGEEYPHQLSGGQQQRVGIARALAAEPSLLLMDEPFGALDPITRGDIRQEFLNLEEFKKKIVVLVTHDVQEAWELGDYIILMDDGKVVQQGSPDELTWEPNSDFVKSFLDPYQDQLEMLTTNFRDISKFYQGPDNVGLSEIKTIRKIVDEMTKQDSNVRREVQKAFADYRYHRISGK